MTMPPVIYDFVNLALPAPDADLHTRIRFAETAKAHGATHLLTRNGEVRTWLRFGCNQALPVREPGQKHVELIPYTNIFALLRRQDTGTAAA